MTTHGEPVPARIEASVILPARNARETIGDQLGALAAQDADVDWELIVVDNGSSDDTAAIAARYRDQIPGLRVLLCSRPGANAARNLGASAARSDRLLFCDADDVVATGWVAALTRSLAVHDAVGGRIDNDTFPPGHMPRYPAGVPVSAGFLPRAITANFGVRAAVWRAVGGFSEEYRYGSTDTEFCWRLQLAGHELGYEPDAVVAYRHRATLRSAARKSYLTGKAQVRLFRDFREAGMPRSSWPRVGYRWLRLAVTSPGAAVWRGFRWRWLRQTAAAAGRVVGSVQLRTRYL